MRIGVAAVRRFMAGTSWMSKTIEYYRSQARPYRNAGIGPFRAKSMDSRIERPAPNASRTRG
jgi:hypothetical protein